MDGRHHRGEPWAGQRHRRHGSRLFADVPISNWSATTRSAGNHVAYFWTFTGTHSGTKNPLRVAGWEEWDLDADLKVKASRGWYDADDYARQTASSK
jgi:hypothetical protein